MNIGKKIKAIRISEGLSQPQMAQLVDMPIGTLRNCEQSRTELKIENLMKITRNNWFDKYAYWLTTGNTLPEAGQIAPDFSILASLDIANNTTNDTEVA